MAWRSPLVLLLTTTVVLLGAPAQAATATHRWSMDEPAGTGTMLDTGKPIRTPGTWENITAGVPGVVRTAYRFNGSSSRVVVQDNDSLDPGASPFTVTAWVNFTTIPTASIGGDYDLVRKGLKGTSGGFWKMEIFPNSSGTQALARCWMSGSGGSTKITNAPSSLNDGAWHRISCAKDDTGITLTVDRTSYHTTASVGSIANSDPLTIGAKKDAGGDWYNGDMDEVSLQIG
jgi:Concanavalin A-like lectin/glucanases superfamily